MTATRDLLVSRIRFDPGFMADQLAPIPWPAGQAPTPVKTGGVGSEGALPSADVLVVTYTAAEGRALADVLTPGVQSTSWTHYTKNWGSFKRLLDSRAPALESERLGSWYLSEIAGQRVICLKSELHPATDGPDLPIVKLWQQMIGDATPKLVITTGTAGGVGLTTELGDVAVPGVVRWDCQEQFKSETWAKASYPASGLNAAMHAALAGTGPLLSPNQGKIPSQYLTRPIKVWESGTTLTTDFFAFGDTNDHFGLLADAPDALVVEMDDAALGLALDGLSSAPPFLSVRNASDPVMPGDLTLAEQSSQASSIYQKYGYFTTVGSAIACWAIVTAL
jgi:nucleoside phosphorylase